MANKTKILFLGSFSFAVPVLQKLVDMDSYEIVGVVTNPDKVAGRDRSVSISPVKSLATTLGLNIIQPEKLRDNDEFISTIRALNPDIGILVGYGKILPKEILTIPKLGIINIHPSLLPKYRGPSPAQASLMNGDTVTGVSIMKVDEEMDHGPLLAQEELTIDIDDNYGSLYKKLFDLGLKLLIHVLPDYINGKLTTKTQDENLVTFSKMIKTEDAEISTKDSVEMAIRKIKAFNPEPGVFIKLPNQKRLKILEAISSPTILKNHDELISSINNKPVLILADGGIELVKVQVEGSKVMFGQDWLRGYTRN